MEYVIRNWSENSSDLEYAGVEFSSIYIMVTVGEVNLTVNGMTFPIRAGEQFDEGFIRPSAFTIDITSGVGTWRGYIRGIK